MSGKPGMAEGSKHPGRDTFTGPPRWVKISALAAGVLLLVIAAVMILSGGEHGPGRHGFGLGAPDGNTGITAAAHRSGQPAVFSGQE